jgi:flagellar FliL protein
MVRGKEPEPEPEVEAPKPKGTLKKLILIGVAAIVLLGGAGFAYLLFTDDEPADKGKAAHKERVTMSLEPFLVNLADKDVRRYLKVKVELEVDNEKASKQLEKSLPRIRDTLIMLLSSKTYQDISTSEGKLLLKQEIMKQLAAMPNGKKISGAYFTEFVAQ